MLRQRARPYLFSNALAPPVAAASLQAFDLLQESTSLRDALERNTRHFRAAMTQARICSDMLAALCPQLGAPSSCRSQDVWSADWEDKNNQPTQMLLVCPFFIYPGYCAAMRAMSEALAV